MALNRLPPPIPRSSDLVEVAKAIHDQLRDEADARFIELESRYEPILERMESLEKDMAAKDVRIKALESKLVEKEASSSSLT